MAEGWGAFYVPRLAKLCTACSGVLRFRLAAMSARASAHLRAVPRSGRLSVRDLWNECGGAGMPAAVTPLYVACGVLQLGIGREWPHPPLQIGDAHVTDGLLRAVGVRANAGPKPPRRRCGPVPMQMCAAAVECETTWLRVRRSRTQTGSAVRPYSCLYLASRRRPCCAQIRRCCRIAAHVQRLGGCAGRAVCRVSDQSTQSRESWAHRSARARADASCTLMTPT